MEEFEGGFDKWRKIIGLFAGPLLMIAILMKPTPSLTPEAHGLLAIIVLVVIFWVSEALPLGVTALMAPVLCIAFGVCDEKIAFANFAHPIIFLFLGSFILAKAMEVHSIDKIIAVKILSLKWVRASVLRFTFMFAFIIFALSGWLSNTATTAMMFP